MLTGFTSSSLTPPSNHVLLFQSIQLPLSYRTDTIPHENYRLPHSPLINLLFIHGEEGSYQNRTSIHMPLYPAIYPTCIYAQMISLLGMNHLHLRLAISSICPLAPTHICVRTFNKSMSMKNKWRKRYNNHTQDVEFCFGKKYHWGQIRIFEYRFVLILICACVKESYT